MAGETDKIETARRAALQVVEAARLSALDVMEKSRTHALEVIETSKLAALQLIEEARIMAVKEAARNAVSEVLQDPRLKEIARETSKRVVEKLSGNGA